MLERLLEMKNSQKPHSQTLLIEPGFQAHVIDREIILAATKNSPNHANLVVCYPSSSIVFRDDPTKIGGIRENNLHIPDEDYHLAVEFTHNGSHVYVDDQYEIVPLGSRSYYARFDLLSVQPVQTVLIPGNTNFKEYLRNLRTKA